MKINQYLFTGVKIGLGENRLNVKASGKPLRFARTAKLIRKSRGVKVVTIIVVSIAENITLMTAMSRK